MGDDVNAELGLGVPGSGGGHGCGGVILQFHQLTCNFRMVDSVLKSQHKENPMNAMEQDQAIAKIIAKAWTDETYKQRLTEKPAEVLKEEGVEIPDGMTFKVVENTPALFHFILPQKPDVELTENDLESVAGGGVIGVGGMPGGIGPYASILNQAAQGIGDLIRLAQGLPTSWDIKIQMMGLK